MKLYYYKSEKGNYGDDLNAWLWERLIPNIFAHDDHKLFLGIGTILNHLIPVSSEKKIVFGSGVGYGSLPKDFGDDKWNVIAVRGPLSSQILGLPPESAVTDAAILVALLPEFSPLPASARSGVAFMPHHETAIAYGQWEKVCSKAGITFIDPRAESFETTHLIRTVGLMITEAMHGAIIADTMRVPWIPVKISNGINYFKWLDWTMSIKIIYAPLSLIPSTLLEAWQNLVIWIAKQSNMLSNFSVEAVLAEQRQRIEQHTGTEWTDDLRRAEKYARRFRRIVALPGIRAVARAVDAVFCALATKKLRNLTKNSRPFLSSDETFNARLAEMQRRLEMIRPEINV